MAEDWASLSDVRAAAHRPAEVAADVPETASAGAAITALRLEGVAPSVAQRKAVLEKLLGAFGSLATLQEAASRALWQAIRDVTPFAAKGPRVHQDIWRISSAT